MNKIKLYIHPTCASSYRVVKKLAEEKLLDKLVLVDASFVGPTRLLSASVWSVPWLVYNDLPAAADPLEPEEAVEIIVNGHAKAPTKPIEAFMEAILHSAYAASLAYIHGDIKPVLDEAFVSAALRSPLGGPNPRQVIEELKNSSTRLFSEWEDKIMRALGVSFVRELWWASGGNLDANTVSEKTSTEIVGLWLIAKASIGRSGLPHKPIPSRERLERLVEFVKKNSKGLLKKIEKEQEKIMSDEEYWSIIAKYSVQGF